MEEGTFMQHRFQIFKTRKKAGVKFNDIFL